MIQFPQLRSLGIESMQRPGERDCLSYVFQSANPSHSPLDSHAETPMRHAAVFPQIEIPLERLFRQSVLTNALEKHLVGCHALRAANDFAITFRREDVHAQRELRPLRVWLHI